MQIWGRVSVLVAGTTAALWLGSFPGAIAQVSTPAVPRAVKTMGTASPYPPFQFYAGKTNPRELIGFDIALAQAIASQLGFTLKVEDMAFAALLPALQEKRLDFALSALTPTPERAKLVDFSEPYLEAYNLIVSRQSTPLRTVGQLTGKRVGVQENTVQEDYLQDLSRQGQNLTLQPYGRAREIIEALEKRKIDAAVLESPVYEVFREDRPELEATQIPGSQPIAYAVAFPKGSPAVAEFNRVLRQMKQNGELELLVRRWFAEQQ